MSKRLTRQDLLDRVNRRKDHGRPLTMRQFQRAVCIARHYRLMPEKTIRRLTKGR